MAIEVREADRENIRDLNRVDGSLWVDSRLRLAMVDGRFEYTVILVPGYLKPYEVEEIDPALYLDSPERVIFFAYLDGQLAGQIILRKNWNLFAWVDDIAVDARFRKQGVGQALMERAVTWAKSRGFPGIMLETQDIRGPACRFYQRFGFTLGGVDRFLYKATLPGTDEIALFWYLVF